VWRDRQVAGICTNAECNAIFYNSEADVPTCPDCEKEAFATYRNCGKKISTVSL
jgi:hypothetical protein